jgi:hypothetical protein
MAMHTTSGTITSPRGEHYHDPAVDLRTDRNCER